VGFAYPESGARNLVHAMLTFSSSSLSTAFLITLVSLSNVQAVTSDAAGLKWTCPRQLGPLKYAQPTWPVVRSHATCPSIAFSCCTHAHDDYLSRLQSVCLAHGVSSKCCDAWTQLSCAACDGMLALGLRPGICPPLCSETLDACRADWVEVDQVSGSPAVCTPDSLLCPTFGDAFASGAALCAAMGLDQQQQLDARDASPQEHQRSQLAPCFEGRTGGLAASTPPARLLAAIANESGSLGLKPDGTALPPTIAPADVVNRAIAAVAAAWQGVQSMSGWSVAVAVGGALAAALVLRKLRLGSAAAGRRLLSDDDDDDDNGAGAGVGRGHQLGRGEAGIFEGAVGAVGLGSGGGGAPVAPVSIAEQLRLLRLARFDRAAQSQSTIAAGAGSVSANHPVAAAPAVDGGDSVASAESETTQVPFSDVAGSRSVGVSAEPPESTPANRRPCSGVPHQGPSTALP
jgi:hypothetical protein